MLVRCLYASRATKAVGDGALDAILKQSRKNNPKRGITGMLCYANGIFVQAIEGGREEVSSLLSVIVKDERNMGVQILMFEEISERRFGNWTMGQVNMASVNSAMLLKYSTRAELDPFALPGPSTMAMMLEIADAGAIAQRNG
jgi:Sensors of blue-light using FAD